VANVGQADFIPVYQAWKELSNALIRGYSSNKFEAWTIPCLYVTGKYLRLFAIKADRSNKEDDKDVNGFQDDFNPDAGKNEKLEDAARVLNRMFQLCLNDRQGKPASSRIMLTTSIERPLRSLANSAHTTSSICFSRHISS
jgi:hypothetical protein